MMHRMTASGVIKTRTKLCPLDRHDDPIFVLLNTVCCKHSDVKNDSVFVEEWYPSALQHANQGKLYLVTGSFTDWASKLMLFSVNFYNKKNLIWHRSSCIRVGLERLYEDKTIFIELK